MLDGNSVSRFVRQEAVAGVLDFLHSDLAQRLMEHQVLVRTWLTGQQPDGSIVLGHEQVPFRSYPTEWPAEMLHEAGLLTIDLAEEALHDRFGLKDATPYNVLFCGGHPVFVDFLSFEPRDQMDPLWRPYSQFVRTFLLPLLMFQHFRIPPHSVFLRNREGLEVEQLLSMASWLQRLHPEMWQLATLPSIANRFAITRGSEIYKPRRIEPNVAKFALMRLFKSARRNLAKLSPIGQQSKWMDYGKLDHVRIAHDIKLAFVTEAVNAVSSARVLDIGCNTGAYTIALAKQGAQVVAIDSDPAVVGHLWRKATEQRLNVLPLVVDIARPTPALGWRNRDESSFLDRACGHFNCVLMLGVLHHLTVNERIPLPEIVDCAARLTSGHLIIEFIPPDDPMFIRLARGRQDLHRNLSLENFYAAVSSKFRIVNVRDVPDSGRKLFHLVK